MENEIYSLDSLTEVSVSWNNKGCEAWATVVLRDETAKIMGGLGCLGSLNEGMIVKYKDGLFKIVDIKRDSKLVKLFGVFSEKYKNGEQLIIESSSGIEDPDTILSLAL